MECGDSLPMEKPDCQEDRRQKDGVLGPTHQRFFSGRSAETTTTSGTEPLRIKIHYDNTDIDLRLF